MHERAIELVEKESSIHKLQVASVACCNKSEMGLAERRSNSLQ